MNTNESLIMNFEHQPLVLFSVVNQVMFKSYAETSYATFRKKLELWQIKSYTQIEN